MAEAPDTVPYQSLYRRFRPSTFAEVRGQDHVVRALRNAVRDQRVAHAYLFSGPRGTGKTSTARILAKALNCTDLHDGEPCGVCPSCIEIAKGTSLDVHELDAASNNGVEAMRDLVSRAALGTPGRQKVYIVDEVHMLSTAASNALLKTLEEPPAHVIFVLATTDPQKVLPTIRSRTQHFEFHLLGPAVLVELLDQVRRDAGLSVPDEALDLAVRRGRGSARDALSVLDQVVASDSVEDDDPELDEVVEALAEHDTGRALVAVAHLTAVGYSPQQLTGDLIDHLRQGFLALVAPELVGVSGSEGQALAAQADRVGLAALVRAMEVLGESQVAMRDAPDPRVNLEVALVRLAHLEADDSPQALLVRIERLETAGHSASGGTRSPVVVRPEPDEEESPAPAPPSPSGPASGSGRKTLGAVRRQAGPAPIEKAPATPEQSVVEAPVVPERGVPAGAVGSGSEPGAGSFPTRDELVQAWGDHIIGRLRPKAKALFQAGRFVRVDGDQAVFGLPNEIHRTRCEEVRGEIEAALTDHFGRPVGLALLVDAGAGAAGGGSAPAGDDPAPLDPGSSTTSNSRAATARSPKPGAGSGSREASRGRPDRSPAQPETGQGGEEPVDSEDLSAFDESQLGEVADVDNSAQARVLQAFPGAEEVN
ncbi:MAG: DNA polymerase III subunit gamma/tau [Acidimicrobiales bacterium]|nr:DNA polymerase III subunit gamma/tau [Acidimicrobiales bacterium]